MSALLDKTLRLDRQKAMALDTEFELATLRDSVMLRMVKGEQADNLAYQQFNTFIENTKKCLDFPLLWELAVFRAFVAEKSEQDREYAQFQILIGHRDNKLIDEGFQQYHRILGRFLIGRHNILIKTLRWLETDEEVKKRTRESLPSALTVAANIPFPQYIFQTA
jgi:hypothetical protein